MATALLFDRDQVEEVDDWHERFPRIGRSAILWLDLDESDDEQIRALADTLDLTPQSREALLHPGRTPRLIDYGSYLHLTAYAPSDRDKGALQRVGCLVSKRWVLTIHEGPLEVLDTFRERASGSGATGKLDGLEFLANLLEWVLQSYLDAFEEIERSLEEIDALAMQGKVSPQEEMLTRLVALRREIGQLRRALTSHREAVLALTRPELGAIASSDSAHRFMVLRERLEEAVQAARDSRDAVVGSFDLLIASTGQRTNDIMKVLTLASVLLLPGSLIAGILGMNFKLRLFEDAGNFWLVLGVIGAIVIGTLVVARVRDWI